MIIIYIYIYIYILCIKMYSGFVIHEIKLWCQFLDPLAVKPGVLWPTPRWAKGHVVDDDHLRWNGQLRFCEMISHLF